MWAQKNQEDWNMKHWIVKLTCQRLLVRCLFRCFMFRCFMFHTLTRQFHDSMFHVSIFLFFFFLPYLCWDVSNTQHNYVGMCQTHNIIKRNCTILHNFCSIWTLYNVIQIACFSLLLEATIRCDHMVWFKSSSPLAAQSFPSIPSSLSVCLSFLFTWNSLNLWTGKPFLSRLQKSLLP
jgi:hypothetical protein